MKTLPNAFDSQFVPNSGTKFGGWQSEFSLPQVTAIAGAGYNFACLDMQHPLTGMSNNELMGMMYALRATSSTTAVLIRVPSPEVAEIAKFVQLGADGLVIPNVDTPEQALAAWKATRFTSQGGNRSISGSQGSNGFGTHNWKMPAVICQLESQVAEAHIDELMRVSEVEHWFIGPSDFATDCGQNDPWEESVRARINNMARTVRKAGKFVGIMEPNVTNAKMMSTMYDFIALGPTFAVINYQLRERLKTARS